MMGANHVWVLPSKSVAYLTNNVAKVVDIRQLISHLNEEIKGSYVSSPYLVWPSEIKGVQCKAEIRSITEDNDGTNLVYFVLTAYKDDDPKDVRIRHAFLFYTLAEHRGHPLSLANRDHDETAAP